MRDEPFFKVDGNVSDGEFIQRLGDKRGEDLVRLLRCFMTRWFRLPLFFPTPALIRVVRRTFLRGTISLQHATDDNRHILVGESEIFGGRGNQGVRLRTEPPLLGNDGGGPLGKLLTCSIGRRRRIPYAILSS